MSWASVDDREFNSISAVLRDAMCHHVDMAIDWDQVIRENESQTDEVDEADESDEPAVDTEETPHEVTPPADD